MVEFTVLVQVIVLILGGLMAAKIGKRLRVPVPIPLLITGYILGADVLNLLKFGDLGFDVAVVAGVVVPLVLFSEGLKNDPKNLRGLLRPVFSISIVAVFVTVFGIALLLHFLFAFGWATAFLVGAILSSTDPAAVIPVLKKLNISKRLSSILEAETALNDATAITLFLVILGAAAGASLSLGDAIAKFVFLLSASVLIGAIVGLLLTEVLKRLKIEHDLFFISLVVMLAAYGLGEYFGASGVIASVVAAIVFGVYLRGSQNDSLSQLYTFNTWEEINFFAIALIFLVLGASISLKTIGAFLPIGIVLALAFVYVVRPITVLVSMYFDKGFTTREKLFIAWLGSPRGTVSAALASLVVAKASEGLLPIAEAHAIFNITLIVIVTTIVITSLSASKVTKWLLRISDNALEDRFRARIVEMKAMLVARRRLQQESKAGLIPPKMYREMRERQNALIRKMERELAEIAKLSPHLFEREQVYVAKSLLGTEMNVIREAFDNKELSESTYNSLMNKYNSLMSNLNIVEEQTRELIQCKDDQCKVDVNQKFDKKRGKKA